MTTGETQFPSAEQYSPVELLEHYRRLGDEFAAEARDPLSVLSEITRTYAPGFAAAEFPITEAGQSSLLVRVGNIIGDKTVGMSRAEVLEKRSRPPLTDAQQTYVFDVATYIGTRFPRSTADDVALGGADFYENNLHLHECFVHDSNDWKVTLEECANGRQAKPRRDLAELSTSGGIVQVSSDRPIPVLRAGKDGSVRVNPEYEQSRALLGRPISDEEKTGLIAASGSGLLRDATEYDVYLTYNEHRGDQPTGRGTGDTFPLEVGCERVDRFVDESGREVTLMQPKVPEGQRASLIDGTRAYLTYLRGNGRLPEGVRLGVVTNGQYCAYKELGLAEILATEFPEVQSLHVVGDETGKRSAEVYLDEIGRLLRNLGKYLTPDESPQPAA